MKKEIKTISLTQTEDVTLYETLNQFFDCLEKSEKKIILRIMEKLSK